MCRLAEFPKEVDDAIAIFEPYMEFGKNHNEPHLRDDAPQEAKNAYKKAYDILLSYGQ